MIAVNLWPNLLDKTDLPLSVVKPISTLLVESGISLSSRTILPETNAILPILELMRSPICRTSLTVSQWPRSIMPSRCSPVDAVKALLCLSTLLLASPRCLTLPLLALFPLTLLATRSRVTASLSLRSDLTSRMELTPTTPGVSALIVNISLLSLSSTTA